MRVALLIGIETRIRPEDCKRVLLARRRRRRKSPHDNREVAVSVLLPAGIEQERVERRRIAVRVAQFSFRANANEKFVSNEFLIQGE